MLDISKHKKKRPKRFKTLEHEKWITFRRADETPAISMYHFVAPAASFRLFADKDRPMVGLRPGVKMVKQSASYFTPSLVPVLGLHIASKVIIWRVPRSCYPTINAFSAEIMATGEVVCWIPGIEWVKEWTKHGYWQNPQWVVFAYETGEIKGELEICKIIGAFKPEGIHYCPPEVFPAKHEWRINKDSEAAGGKIKIVDTTLIVNQEMREYFPLSVKPT